VPEDSGAPRPKLDPHALSIRSEPQRAIRFRRPVIVGGVVVVSLVIAAASWRAFDQDILKVVVGEPQQTDAAAKPSGDIVAKAPATYADVPQLGPPLPGDLGKAILDRQRGELAFSGSEGDQRVAQAAASQQEHRLAEQQAAREAPLIVQGQNNHATPAQMDRGDEQPALSAAANAPGAASNRLALDAQNDPNAQGRKLDFIEAHDGSSDVNPHRLTPAASPYLLSAGSVISASLITGLRSDLPGLVIAQVTENVYDSATGQLLLLPQGSRLIGTYDSVVAFGQSRALVIWQRIVLPSGASIRLENVPATDVSGYAGLADKVDFHTWALLKGVAISTLLGVGSQLALSGQSDLVQALRLTTQDNVSRAGDQITQRNLQVQPTIAIRPGAKVRLVVHRDLILAPWGG
jgi:type IV secretion system protein VirB10